MSFDKMPLAERGHYDLSRKVFFLFFSFFFSLREKAYSCYFFRSGKNSKHSTDKINTLDFERSEQPRVQQVLIFSSGGSALSGQTTVCVWQNLIVLLSLKQWVIIIAYLIIL